VPNDFYSASDSTVQIVTGCNMSGKSTHIKTAAVLQILAQMGSFVPAHSATFPVIKKLFTRMSKDDSIEGNLSTFSKEMKEIQFILR
jgi:DNA mismatch repair ATPase MutS